MYPSKLLLGIACAAMSVASQAQVLLQIDVTDPAAVRFTATPLSAGADASINGFSGGVTLMDFFTAESFSQPSPGNGLTAAGVAMDSLTTTGTQPGTGGVYFGLNLNISGGNFPGSTLNFTTSSAAFDGTVAVNMNSNPSWYLNLPADGATGNIQVGSEVSDVSPLGTVIGQWEVTNLTAVPEPATVGLAAGLALGGFAFARRRLKKA